MQASAGGADSLAPMRDAAVGWLGPIHECGVMMPDNGLLCRPHLARRITTLHERRHRRIGNLTTEIDLPIGEMMAALDVAYVP